MAGGAEQNFDALAARLHGLQDGIGGDLVITTVPELCRLMLPAIQALMARHPALRPCLRTEERVLQLEYGEAHLAIRAGSRPQEPDNVVQALGDLPFGLYGAESYLKQYGTPSGLDDLDGHMFIAADAVNVRAPFDIWLRQTGHKVALRSNSITVRADATRAGIGLGFLTPALAPAGLVQVVAPQPDWSASIWLVTHVDLHRSAKVQAATAAIKQVLTSSMATP